MTKKTTSVLFIGIHRPERSPSQRFRFEQYIEFLSRNGYECEQHYLLNKKDDKHYYGSGILYKILILLKSVAKLVSLSFFRRWDIVFVQREAFMLGTSFFEKAMTKRSKMIFDLDDSIWMHQTGEVKSKNKIFYFLKNPEKTKKLVSYSDMIFAGNRYLADFCEKYNQNVKIIPTTIDTDLYQRKTIKQERSKICIGWSGSFSTITHFEFLVPCLEKIYELHSDKIYFKVIGDGTYRNEKLNLKGDNWNKETELEDLSEIDIGLMPLPDDEWTKGKCGLKGLQYMALEIPTIMSAVGVNTKIIDHGKNGFLAENEDEWIDIITTLIEGEELRFKVGKAGRKTVVENYSVKAIAPLYLKYFNELRDS